MREWRTVHILPRQRPVYAFFAGEWVAAGRFSQNWLCKGDTSCGCGGYKEPSTADHD
jgi:hypothetical protein